MDTIKTLHGYTIKNGKLYLKGIYKGVPSWTTDYTYAKAYRTESKALETVEKLVKYERGLCNELNRLRTEYNVTDHSPKMIEIGRRITEIRKELGMNPMQPRKNRRPPKVVNR